MVFSFLCCFQRQRYLLHVPPLLCLLGQRRQKLRQKRDGIEIDDQLVVIINSVYLRVLFFNAISLEPSSNCDDTAIAAAAAKDLVCLFPHHNQTPNVNAQLVDMERDTEATTKPDFAKLCTKCASPARDKVNHYI